MIIIPAHEVPGNAHPISMNNETNTGYKPKCQCFPNPSRYATIFVNKVPQNNLGGYGALREAMSRSCRSFASSTRWLN
jgi:hypothetical protein